MSLYNKITNDITMYMYKINENNYHLCIINASLMEN